MNFFQHSFAAGEIAPALFGRVDLTKYSTGLRTCRNFFISRNGGAFNRPGLGYRAPVQDPTNLVRLKQFTTQQGYKYLLEFGNFYLRVTDQGIPVTTQAIPLGGYSAGGTTTTTLITGAAHGFKVGDAITFTLVGSTGSVTNQAATITAVANYTITVSFNSSGFGSFTSGSASLVTQRTVSFTTPWSSAILRQLTFAQDQNVMTIVHQSVYPQTLTYLGRQAWTFGNVSMDPKTQTPTNIVTNPNTPGNTQIAFWGITAIDGDTFEESYVATVSSSVAPSSSAPVNLTWTPVAGAIEYNVYYGGSSGTLGFKTVVYSNGFQDLGNLNVDFTDPPPIPRSFFTAPGTPNSTSAFPAAVGIFQQRRWYGNIGPVLEYPPAILPSVQPAADRIIGSRIGSPTFFANNRPLNDDDAISFRIVHRDPQTVRHFMDLGKLVVFTEQGEWVLGGGGDSGITPSQINPTCVSQNGSGDLAPLQIGNLGIYRQKKGSMIRTFGFEFAIEGYRGDDLTVFSNHLVDKNVVVAWDYQKVPHPIIWMARDDGTMLSLTFVPEQGIVAWARHDTQNGIIEDVCQCDDRVYFVVRRTINGQTVRYIERMHNRQTTPINQAIYMDASVSMIGTLPAGQSVTISGGTTWDNNDVVTITLAGGTFSSSALPGAVHVTGPDGTFVRLTGLTYVSPTQVTAQPQRLIPVTMQNVALTNAALAQVTITGLSHLEGQQVSVIGDGFVVASPNNQNYPAITVTGGQITLPLAYGVVHVGLPITAELETLNIDTAQGQSILDKMKAITQVAMWVQETRGLMVGAVPPEGITLNALQGLDATITSMYEPKVRYSEGYSQPNQLLTRVITQPISGQWNSHGRVLVRQVDPLPAAVLAIAPAGLAPVGM